MIYRPIYFVTANGKSWKMNICITEKPTQHKLFCLHRRPVHVYQNAIRKSPPAITWGPSPATQRAYVYPEGLSAPAHNTVCLGIKLHHRKQPPTPTNRQAGQCLLGGFVADLRTLGSLIFRAAWRSAISVHSQCFMPIGRRPSAEMIPEPRARETHNGTGCYVGITDRLKLR